MLSPLLYPEPGSNRHGLLHWCLRPARLPIPPSGLSDGKFNTYFPSYQILWPLFRFYALFTALDSYSFVDNLRLTEHLPATVFKYGRTAADRAYAIGLGRIVDIRGNASAG